jgi:hypothetical protein
MLTRTQILVSSTGNISDIKPYVHSNGKDFFIIGDDHGNTVLIEPIISLIGIEIVASAKGMTLPDYLNKLNEEVSQWKKEVCPEPPKEEPKAEDPKVIEQLVEKKEDESVKDSQ